MAGCIDYGPSGTISNNSNFSGNPQIKKTGDRWGDYYEPAAASNLIDAGYDVGLSYAGSAPDVGRWEDGLAVQSMVTFDSQQGSMPDPSSKAVIQGSAYGTLPSVTRAGYTFDGWYTAASSGTQVIATTNVSAVGDHVLYAQWTMASQNW